MVFELISENTIRRDGSQLY